MDLIRKNHKSITIIMLCLGAAIATIVTASGNSRVIPFQGLLTDNTGAPIVDGTYDLKFTLYGSSDAVVPLQGWFENHMDVPVKNGRFSVVLGNITSFDNPPGGGSISFSQPIYIGMQVGSDNEMRPRKQIMPAVHAYVASEADHTPLAERAIIADNGVPVGSIMPYMGTSAPVGWLMCNGDPIPAGSDFNALRTILGSSNAPDLRGMFLRGAGQNADASYRYANDSSRIAGSLQDDKTKLPDNSLTISTNGNHSHSVPGGNLQGGAPNVQGWADDTSHNFPTNSAGAHNHTISGGDEETRPNNYAVNYIIKY